MKQSLGHLSVLDFSETLAGQFCARLLADFGAGVILLEPPDGSAIRRHAPLGPDGTSLMFHHLNTGKRSIRCDRSTEPGRTQFEAFVRSVDIVIVPHDFDPREIERLNAGATVVLLSSFGRQGPLSHWRGPEIVLQAMSGMMNNNGRYGQMPLYGVGNRSALAAGLAAYVGVLAAEIARLPGEAGQTVAVEAAEAAVAMAFPYVMQFNYNGTIHNRAIMTNPSGQVLCRDGWVCIWIYSDRWRALLGALGLPQLESDPRFCEPVIRRQNWTTLFSILQETVAELSAEELVTRLHKSDVISAKACTPTEVVASEHLKARGYWEQVQGRRVLGPPFRLTRTPRQLRMGAPILGADDALPPPPPKPAGSIAPGTARLPLAGLRVVELTTAWAGPMAGRLLAYFGAESIHVEAPNRVNTWRLNKDIPNPINFPAFEPGKRHFDRSFLFNSQNVNKRSLILNLKAPGGIEALRKLLAKTDVLICNFRPGTLEKLGLDFESLRRAQPAIIVAELPAFGSSGPMSGHAALGPTMEMAAGMAAMIGYSGGQPETTGPSYLDPVGGFNAAAAILTALVHRTRTGEGQYVEVPQVEAAMQLIGAELLHAAETGIDPVRNGNRVLHAAPHDAYPALGEDQWVVIAAENETQWLSLSRAMGRPDLLSDPRFLILAARLRHQDALDTIIAEWTMTRDKHAVAELLQGLGVAAAPVLKADEIAGSAYLASRGFFTSLDHPDAGRHLHPGLPVRLGRTPGSQRKAAPCFGEDNRFLAETVLEMDPDAISALEQSGVTARHPKPVA